MQQCLPSPSTTVARDVALSGARSTCRVRARRRPSRPAPPTIRFGRIARIRSELALGVYETPEKLDAALDALLQAV